MSKAYKLYKMRNKLGVTAYTINEDNKSIYYSRDAIRFNQIVLLLEEPRFYDLWHSVMKDRFSAKVAVARVLFKRKILCVFCGDVLDDNDIDPSNVKFSELWEEVK